MSSQVPSRQRISVVVASHVRDPENPPIEVRPFWGVTEFDMQSRGINPQRVYATVTKGYINSQRKTFLG